MYTPGSQEYSLRYRNTASDTGIQPGIQKYRPRYRNTGSADGFLYTLYTGILPSL